ncbi:MAG: glycine dehydrogenase (aminomethyl-transferring), partial [Longimicrobiales bacterium]
MASANDKNGYDVSFQRRHIGPGPIEVERMLEAIGYDSVDALIDATIPANIRLKAPLNVVPPAGEHEALAELRGIASHNRVMRSYIGLGYYDTLTPPVIQRKVLENPCWYTAYTPYQAEIAQGRLEALLNFQTVVIDLTGLPIANASLLDEATAAAEAMVMAHASAGKGKNTFLVSDLCNPQTIDVVKTRAVARGIAVAVASHTAFDINDSVFGVLLQYPAMDGSIHDYREICERAHAAHAVVTVATDLLALTLLTPPGEFGADVVVGSSQRLGVPLGYGGPHAAFFATKDEFKRQIPGRIIGVSRDSRGEPALRMALQTREQHIRREKATSNICTAQVLLAVIASFFAVYHGPEGLRDIARRVRGRALALAAGLRSIGFDCGDAPFFDTVSVNVGDKQGTIMNAAVERGINLRALGNDRIAVAFDETVTDTDVAEVLSAFG